MSSIKKTDHYYLIDGSGYIFRAYYALPPLSRKSDGLPTGAVSGFCSMLFKLLEDSRSDDSIHKPTHFAVIFDSARKNFRNDIYSEYKANRAEAPDDLAPQFEYIRKSVEAFNLPSIELLNYEADDLIATYAKKITEAGAKVTVISSPLYTFSSDNSRSTTNRGNPLIQLAITRIETISIPRIIRWKWLTIMPTSISDTPPTIIIVAFLVHKFIPPLDRRLVHRHLGPIPSYA